MVSPAQLSRHSARPRAPPGSGDFIGAKCGGQKQFPNNTVINAMFASPEKSRCGRIGGESA
eukprot:7761282-Pyramimonas_sp.AAC.1